MNIRISDYASGIFGILRYKQSIPDPTPALYKFPLGDTELWKLNTFKLNIPQRLIKILENVTALADMVLDQY